MPDIPHLIQQLIEPATGEQAYQPLVDLGTPAVDPLIAAFETTTTEFGQHQIALVLRAIGDVRAVPALIQWAQSSPSRARQSAVIALGAFGKDARVPDVLREVARRDPDSSVRLVAVSAVGLAVNKDAEKEIWFEMLDDSVDQVAMNAVSNLPGKFKGDPSVVDAFLAALSKRQPSDKVADWIINALSQLGDPRAFDALVPYLSSDNPHTRAIAASGLGKMRDPRAVDLLKPLTSDKGFAWEEDHGGPKYTVGDIAKQALANLGQKPPDDGKSDSKSGAKKPFWKFW
jgi:HEAT repeat protein